MWRCRRCCRRGRNQLAAKGGSRSPTRAGSRHRPSFCSTTLTQHQPTLRTGTRGCGCMPIAIRRGLQHRWTELASLPGGSQLRAENMLNSLGLPVGRSAMPPNHSHNPTPYPLPLARVLALDVALTPSPSPTCRWHPVTGVYVKLVRAGLVAQLDDDAQCWRLASILVAGSADTALTHRAPAHTGPILTRRDFNLATALVDGKTSLRRGSGTTGGLIDAGFEAVPYRLAAHGRRASTERRRSRGLCVVSSPQGRPSRGSMARKYGLTKTRIPTNCLTRSKPRYPLYIRSVYELMCYTSP